MEIISLRIRTRDEAYGQVLATVLRRNYPGFLITVSSIEERKKGGDEAATTDWITASGRSSTGCWGFDLGLCDDREALQEDDVLLVDLPAQETVGTDGEIQAGEKQACLFKYAPAGEMIQKILGLCSSRMHRRIFHPADRRCRIIGVFAASGGRGCTALCLALAQLAARLRGAKPLLLPLGQLVHGDLLAGPAGALPLRDYIYRTLRTKDRDQREELLERAAVKDAFGTGHFASAPGENPLYRLSQEGMQTVLGAMTEGPFDMLVADVGTVLNEASYAVLRAADRLLMLCSGEAADKAAFEHLRAACGGGVLPKIIRIANRDKYLQETPIDRFYEEPGQPDALQAPSVFLPYEPLLDTRRGAAFDTVFPLEGGFTDAAEEVLNLLDRAIPGIS